MSRRPAPRSTGAADDYCYVTTTGRRTGRPHRIEIWYAAEGNILYLLSGGGRSSDWVRNLTANPAVVVEVEGDVFSASAWVPVGEEAEQARSLVFAKYAPRYDGDLTGWRQRALPIAIDLSESTSHDLPPPGTRPLGPDASSL
jgi:deazaflavin-dependent oxidoreductase (nitroreductase family)